MTNDWRRLAGLVPGPVVGLMAAATLLRLFALGGQSLWIDEVLSIQGARKILDGDLVNAFFNRRGPLYLFLLAAILPASPSEFLVRLPSALLGVAAVLVAYHLGRETVCPRAGIWTAGLMTVSPFAIWYSQEARYVNLFVLLSSLSILFALRYVEGGGRRDLALHAASSVLMLLSFVGGIFVLLAQNLWVAFVQPQRSRLKGWVLAQTIVSLLFVPWLIRAYGIGSSQVPRGETDHFSLTSLKAGHSRPAHPIQIGYAVFTFGVGFTLGPSTRELHQDRTLRPVRERVHEVGPAILFTGLAALGGFVHCVRLSRRKAALILLCLLCPLLGAYLTGSVSRIAFNVRYAAAGFLPFTILAAAGVLSWSRRSLLGWILVIGLAGTLGHSLANHYGNEEYAKDDNRGAAEILRRLRRPQEPLVIGADARALRFYYDAPFYKWHAVRVVEPPSEDQPGGTLAADRIWVVATRPWESAGFETFLQSMTRCFPVEARFEPPGVQVMAFRVRSGETPTRCTVRTVR